MTTPGLAILTGNTLSVDDVGPSGDVIMTSLLGIALVTDNVVSVIPAGTAGQVLTSNGPNAAPTFQNVPGTLPPVVLGLGFDLLHLGTLLTPTNTNQTLTHDSSSTVNAALMNAPITQPSYWEITVNHTAGSTDIRLGVGINSISLTAALGATGGASVQDNGVVTVNGSTGTPQSALPSTTIGVAANPSTKRLWVGAPGAPAGSGIDISALSGLLYPAISLNGNVTAITINTQPTLPSGYNALVAGSVPIPPVTPATIGFDSTHTSTNIVLSSSNTIATRNSTGSPGGECALVNAPITAPSYWEMTVIHNGRGATGEFSWGVGTNAAVFQADYCGDVGSAAIADNGTVVVNGVFSASAAQTPPAVTLGIAYDPVGKRLNIITPGSLVGVGTGIDCSSLAGAVCYPMFGLSTSTSSVSINSNPAVVPAGYTALVASGTAIPTPPPPPTPSGGNILPTGASVSAGASVASIQAAVNGLAAGHSLVMGAGTYNWAGGTVNLKSNIMIVTSGLVTINGCPADATAAVFNGQGTTGTTVRGDVAGHLVLTAGMIDFSSGASNWTVGNVVFNGGDSSAFDGAAVRFSSSTLGLIINCDFNNVNSTMVGMFDWDNITFDGLHVTGGVSQFCSVQNSGDVNRGRNIIFQRCAFQNFGRGGLETAGTSDGTNEGTYTYLLNFTVNNCLFTGYYTQGTPGFGAISNVSRAQTGTVISNNFFKLNSAYSGYTEGIEINSSNGVCDTFNNTLADITSPFPTYGSAGQNAHNNFIFGAGVAFPGNNTTLGSDPSIPSLPARIAF